MDPYKPLLALLAIGNPIGVTRSLSTRLMGLILAALAVEVMSDGLIKLLPALTGLSR